MQVFNIRVSFVGYFSRMIETKEFQFVAEELRDQFVNNTRAIMSPDYQFKVEAVWEETIYQDWSKARVALVDAATKKAR